MSNQTEITLAIVDQAVREKALNTNVSYIVQAPAGSGKTTLLIQRYLALLADKARKPEEILAITFTRKAAAEMRHRILAALANATQEAAENESLTLQLARRVLQKDEKFAWNILQNPTRLRIQTIDSLCASICARLPILSQYGIQPKILDKADLIYQQAVQQLFLDFNENPAWADSLEYLLSYFDNRVSHLQVLFVEFLKLRDQWLVYLSMQHRSENFKEFLEKSLRQISLECMEKIHKIFPKHLVADLLSVARFAAENLPQEKKTNEAIRACSDLFDLPAAIPAALPEWEGLITLLFTQKQTWRASLDKNIGLPPKTKQKESLMQILAVLSQHEDLRQALENLRNAPPVQYTETQWEMLNSLIKILPILLAELHLVFQKNECVDFLELSLSALHALGEPEYPTDLTLYFDHQLQHLLVDEFQDTSIMQFHLLERLTAGWEPGDGRTLFLVGDPMQSIYRFRNAEVSLFLHAQKNGVGTVALESLVLQTNFRSHPDLITWSNTTFRHLFPQEIDLATGAIPHSPAFPAIQAASLQQAVVQYHLFIKDTDVREEEKIISLIQQYQRDFPDETIAILVRSRPHLRHIILALQHHGISFQAIEIQELSTCLEVQDLFSLTCALLNQADHLSWLSILRAPWCGLTLKDLHTLTNQQTHLTLLEKLFKFESIENLSTDARLRLQRIMPVLKKALANKARLPLTQWIKGTWMALGGPACLKQKTELSNVEAYFKLLNTWQENDSNQDLQQLKNELRGLYAAPDPKANKNIQIMTIHKAKGLEFEHVLIPGLIRNPPHDKQQLLLWQERLNQKNEIDLILGPLRSDEESEQDPIYKYLQDFDKIKADYETARLFYVAVTRAKKTIHFFSEVTTEADGLHKLKKPAAGSFLHLLWEQYHNILQDSIASNSLENFTEQNQLQSENYLERLVDHWRLPKFAKEFSEYDLAENENKSLYMTENIQLENRDPQILGVVIHEALQKIAEQGVVHWQRKKILGLHVKWRNRLLELGHSLKNLDQSVQTVITALCNTLENSRGSWILSSNHQQAYNEYPLSFVMDQKIHHLIIDRWFIDTEGTHWIIDYKTSTPGPLPLEIFLDLEKNTYHQQLSLYAQALYNMKQQPIHLGLYFPLCNAWIEWEHLT